MIKSPIFAACLLFLSNIAYAQSDNDPADRAAQILNDASDFACRQISELAKVIMQYRQKNTPLPVMLKHVNSAKPVIRPKMRIMILEAFSEPLLDTEKGKEEMAQKFKDDIELRCYKREF